MHESIRTIGSLLLSNSDFKAFLSDLSIVGKQIISETSLKISEVAQEAAREIDPSSNSCKNLENTEINGSNEIKCDIASSVEDVGEIFKTGVKKTLLGAKESTKDNFSKDHRKILINRLRAAVTQLRKKNDYSKSVNVIGLLIKRCGRLYSRAIAKTISTVQEDFDTNDSLGVALDNIWSLLTSFGDREAWNELEKNFKKVMDHSNKDLDFENLMTKLSRLFEQIFTEPNFFDYEDNDLKITEIIRENFGVNTSLNENVSALLSQVRATYECILDDEDVSQLLRISENIWSLVFSAGALINPELLTDITTVLAPNIVQKIKYIPIPRLEVSVPEIDLLAENLIIEPGHNFNNSFFPSDLNIQFFNDLSLHQARFRTISSVTSLVTIKLKGLSLRADEIGYWLRLHTCLLRFTDEGIASIEMDERGLDIELDIEIGKDRLEKILTLKDVRIKIHHFSYFLRKSKISYLTWFFKPIIRPLIRNMIEHKLAISIRDFFHATNRELLYARERLRATRISDPQDLRTFVEAVVTRLAPKDDPNVYVNLGLRGAVDDQDNIFSGRYAPGSVVKLWDKETTRANELMNENVGPQGWRSKIFDIQVQAL